MGPRGSTATCPTARRAETSVSWSLRWDPLAEGRTKTHRRKARVWGWAAALTAALIVGAVLLHPRTPRVPKSGPAVTLTLPGMLAVYAEASRIP